VWLVQVPPALPNHCRLGSEDAVLYAKPSVAWPAMVDHPLHVVAIEPISSTASAPVKTRKPQVAPVTSSVGA